MLVELAPDGRPVSSLWPLLYHNARCLGVVFQQQRLDIGLHCTWWSPSNYRLGRSQRKCALHSSFGGQVKENCNFCSVPIIGFIEFVFFDSSTSQLHNGSLYLLPFTNTQDHAFHLSAMHHQSKFRCRATNAYGRIVSTVITVKPGEYWSFKLPQDFDLM